MRKKPRRAGQDIAWRQVLSHPTALKELLTDFVPEAAPLLRGLDFTRAEVVGGTFSDALLAELKSDVIWRVPARNDRECIVYVHIEHQSTCERLMALRMLRYMAALYGAIVGKRRRKKSAALPLILPIVLYSGSRSWHAPLRFEDLLADLPPGITPPLTARYCLVNVRALDDGVLRRVGNALSALFQLEKARLRGESVDLEAVTRSMTGEEDWSLVEAVWIATYNILESTRGPEAAEPVREFIEAERAEERRMPLTMGEYLMKCANELARKAARKEGREETREHDRKQALSSLHRAMRRRGVNPDAYAKDLAAIEPLRKVVDLVAGVAAAKDPRAYLRRRFGH